MIYKEVPPPLGMNMLTQSPEVPICSHRHNLRYCRPFFAVADELLLTGYSVSIDISQYGEQGDGELLVCEDWVPARLCCGSGGDGGGGERGGFLRFCLLAPACGCL